MMQGGLILAAGRVRSKKKKIENKKHEQIRRTQNAPRNTQQPVDRATSRWRVTKHVPRASPYSPASIDPGFVEIGLVQLSRSVKMTNVTHTHTDRHTDRQIK